MIKYGFCVLVLDTICQVFSTHWNIDGTMVIYPMQCHFLVGQRKKCAFRAQQKKRNAKKELTTAAWSAENWLVLTRLFAFNQINTHSLIVTTARFNNRKRHIRNPIHTFSASRAWIMLSPVQCATLKKRNRSHKKPAKLYINKSEWKTCPFHLICSTISCVDL